MASKSVSIILPNYNHAQYLQERLDSLFNQTHQDFEVIILDDASTDGSQNILTPYKDHPKVTHFIINEKNTGSPFKQWEKGITLATGEYIWIAESDDFCDINFLESQLQHLGDAHAVVSKTLIVDKKGTVSHEHVHPIFVKGSPVLLTTIDFLSCPISNISAVLFKNTFKNDAITMAFSQHHIIGDVFFYFENFNSKTILYNSHTSSYLRRPTLSVSNLSNKSLGYFSNYFKEHIEFIKYVRTMDLMSYRQLFKPYIKKYFNKIRNRVPTDKKRSLSYFMLYLKYKYFLNFGFR